MKAVSLKAQARSLTRRKGAKDIRAGGRIPAVIYGKHNPPQNLEVVSRDFDLLVHQAHSEIILVNLEIPGDANPSRLALVQDVQHHPLTGKTLHIDFHEVKPDETVTVDVPVESTGVAEGVKNGGVLEHVRFKLRVRCQPGDLPEQIVVDVSSLGIGTTLHIGDITPPPGVKILGDAKVPVFAVAAPTVEAEPEPAAGAEAAKQPEMIKEKKADDAKSEAAKAPAKK